MAPALIKHQASFQRAKAYVTEENWGEQYSPTTPSDEAIHVALSALSVTMENKDWVFDSGASNHFVGDPLKLE